MTTAARPTFDPAKGGSGVREKSLGKLSQQVSARDQRAHLTLKERLPGQDTIDEVSQRDLKSELEDRERIAAIEKAKGSHFKYIPSLEQTTQLRLALKHERDKERGAEKDALLDTDSIVIDSTKEIHLINARKMAQLDADDDFSSINSDSDFDDDDDDGGEGGNGEEDFSDEDDPAELMAELEKIKQERALEEKRKEEEKEKRKEEQMNLSSSESSFSIKRRWDDDVPFKNCARAEPEKKKLYINDTLRQDFHKKFMDKYIG